MRATVSAFCLLALAGTTPALALDGPFKAAYKAGEVDLVNLVGTFEVVVGGPDVSVAISGRPEELKDISVTMNGTALRIESTRRHRDIEDDAKDYGLFKIAVPKGTTLSTDRIIGVATIGDVQGDLKFSAMSVKAQIGAMKSAELRIPGSAKITLGEVAGALVVRVSGSGTINAASADSADVLISGEADVKMHDVRHAFSAMINGSGDIEAASVDGPVTTQIAGSGHVTIGRGRATPLKLTIMGQGGFTLHGEAVDPVITVMGMGDVKLGKITGKLTSRGQTNLQVGN